MATEPLPRLLRLFSLEGRTAIVTGGHGDVAAAIAETLAELGASVALAARKVQACEELAQRLGAEYGARALAVATDVSREEEVQRLVALTAAELGSVDILVNGAATFWAAAPEDVPTEKGWRRVLEVNLTGAFVASREAGRLMLAQGRGSIINVASTGGLMSFLPEVGATISYTTSKAALISLTRDLAAQWAERGVRVNAIAPGSMAAGMTDTIPQAQQKLMIDRIPMRRQGRPDELRGAIAYLASDASSYTTGSVLVVDGGQTIV